MSRTVILLGPVRAGKSTIARLLASRLGLPHVSMDDVRFGYYQEIGYDEELAKAHREGGDFWALYRYWKPFEVHAVERVLSDYRDVVIDFGAGHSVHDDGASFSRIQQALQCCSNVVLLLPSPGPCESREVLASREPSLSEIKPDINEFFLTHPSNRRLAKFIVYTNGKSPEQTCEDILRLVQGQGA